MIDFLFTNALAGLALAAIAGVLIWTFRPAPAVRHALWLIVLLKLVSPTGLVVEVPLPVEQSAEQVVAAAKTEPVVEEYVVEQEIFTVIVELRPGQSVEEAAALALRHGDDDEFCDESSEPAIATTSSVDLLPKSSMDYRPYLLGLWVLGALVIGARQGRETIRFARFTRRSVPASDALVDEVAAVARRLSVVVPSVRVLPGLTSPVMWCLWMPVLLWPAGLECRLRGDGRRAVIAHELAHLRRRDHWVRRLEMVAAILHWWNPLFWVARRKLRADAELACDAWATGQADRRAYAEALLEVCSYHPRRRPAPAVGVIGEGRHAMQERLTMIMRDRVPCRLAFGAKLVVALMALAAIPAWTLGQSAPTKTKPQGDPQVTEIENQIRALGEKLEALKAQKKAEAEAEKQAAEQVKKAEAAAKKAEEAAREKIAALKLKGQAGNKIAEGNPLKILTREGTLSKVLVAGQDGVKVIGADGKELKDVKVIITDTKGGAEKILNWTTKPLTTTEQPLKVRVADPTITETKTARVRAIETKPGQEGRPIAITVEADPKTGKIVTKEEKAFTLQSDSKTGAFAFTPLGDKSNVYGVAGQGGTHTLTLSRATYKLSKDQAAALGNLLGSIKATVMETKVDGENVTVTTTPEAQAAIGQIVRLVQGQGTGSTNTYRFTTTPEGRKALAVPVTPPVPATPVAPTKPAKPANPTDTKKPEGSTAESVEKFIELKLDSVKPILEKFDLDKSIELKLESGLKELEKLKDLENFKDLEKLKNLSEEIKLKLKDLKPADEKKKTEKPSK